MPLPFEGLVEAVGRGQVKACYLLAGPDGLQQRAVLRALGPLAGPIGPTVLQGPACTPADVVGALESPSLGGGRVVVVEDCPWVVAPSTEGGRAKGEEQPLVAWLQRPAVGAVLVLRSNVPADRRRKLVRAVEEVGAHLATVAPRDQGEWLRRQGAAVGLQLGRGLWAVLSARLDGETCERMATEVAKLQAYGPGLDEHALDALVPPTVQERTYDLVDACIQGDGRRVLDLAEALVQQGEPVPKLLFTLGAQLRTLAEVAGRCRDGSRPESHASALGIHPFVAKKALSQAERLGVSAWARACRAVWTAELAWKSGQWQERTALDQAVLGVLEAARGLERAGGRSRAAEVHAW